MLGASTLWICVAVLFSFKECGASNDERDLFRKLRENYDPNVRPVEKFDDLIVVNFSLALQQIIDLDEKAQLLTTSIYMTWSWYDVHLKWDPLEHGNITSIRMPAKQAWKPDILVYNSAVDPFDQMLHTNVIVRYDGYVEWLPPGIFKTTCSIDILYFPFDEQKCSLKFGTWTHHGRLVDLNMLYDGNADISAFYKSGEWDLISMKGENHSIVYECCPDPFVDITFTIHMRRKTLFYGFNLILPCVLVCSLTILIFILPADSGERITLGITVLLAMVVFLQLVAENLPPTGVIPLLGKYFACSIVMVTLSVVASVLSLNFHYTSTATIDSMPRWIELLFLQWLPKILFMKMPGQDKPQTFVPRSENGNEGVPLIRVGQRLGNWQNDLHDNKDPATSLAMQLKHSEKQIGKMCGDLHDMVQRMRDDEEDDEIAKKWRFAASVLDRFCLIFFIIFFIMSTFLTIGLAPGVLFSRTD